MNKIVFKSPIIGADVVLGIQKDAILLSVQLQRGTPCLWWLCDQEAPVENRRFRLYGTGHTIEDDVNYIGTVQLLDGALVYHIFEVME